MTRALPLSLVVFVSGCMQQQQLLIPCDEGLHDQIVVFSAWHHSVVSDPGSGYVAAGFDLDRTVSDGTGPDCTDEEDFVSPFSGGPGIDNQYAANLLPLLLSTDAIAEGPDALIMEQLLRGESVFGLEVILGVDRVPLVGLVELVPVDPMTADPSRSALSPNQRFHIVRRERVAARCVGGNALELALPTFDAPMGDPIVAVPLHDVHMNVAISPTGELGSGELGARYPVSFAVEVGRLVGEHLDESTVRAVGGPDLDPTSDPTVCNSISFGVGFDLVPATVVP